MQHQTRTRQATLFIYQWAQSHPAHTGLPQADRQHDCRAVGGTFRSAVGRIRRCHFTGSKPAVHLRKRRAKKKKKKNSACEPLGQSSIWPECAVGKGEGPDNPRHLLSSSAPVISRKSPRSKAAALTQSVSLFGQLPPLQQASSRDREQNE